MHDAITSEREGTPAIGVMTSNFVSAAELMSRVLGLPKYDFGVIEHPISSADGRGLEMRAEATVKAIRRIALAPSAGSA